MKFSLQEGNLDQSLSALHHLMCAVFAGKSLRHLREYNVVHIKHVVHFVLTRFHCSSTPSLLLSLPVGALTLTATNPIWVVKTRMCLASSLSVPHYMQYSGLSEGLSNLWRHEGIRGLYTVSSTLLSFLFFFSLGDVP